MDEVKPIDPQLFTLAELAKKHGQVQAVPVSADFDDGYSRWHRAADVRHGWAQHKYMTGEDVMLRDEDYLKAIEATKDRDSQETRHWPANFRKVEETQPVSEELPTKKKKKGGAQ